MDAILQNIKDGKYENDLVYPPARGGSNNPEDMKKWWQEDNRLTELFKTDFLAEFGVTDNPKSELCYEIAWRDGHAEGLEAVYHEFEELVELIQ